MSKAAETWRLMTDLRFALRQMVKSSALKFLQLMTLAGRAILVEPVQPYLRSNSYD
jgi:hypothetical protein